MRAWLSLASVGTALAALAIAGCGGDDNTTTEAATTAGAPSADGQVVTISETDFKLDPSDPTVEPGTVSFEVTNDGAVDHNLEVEGPEGEQELEQDLSPGESGTLTVDLSQPGSYEMYCPVGDHRDRGMEGEVTVTGGSGAAGGGGASSGSGSDDEGGTTTTTTTGGGYSY
jgi:uncharacterized cupredoxin-like copper-binding protein